ncbi:MAG TPA: histidine kinase [Allosphingosinicella sp.]|uniref:sensor histidine kinase n=1 Tax=Allosphingosinicella sp. TaxID=2823234 RepID=UPI002F2812B8
MASIILPRPSGRFHDLPLAIKSILGFWFFYFVTMMLRALVIGHGVGEMFSRRTAGIVIGIILTFGVYAALRFFARNSGLKRMTIVAAIASVPAAFLFSLFNFNAFFVQEPLVSRNVAERARDGLTINRSGSGELRILRRDSRSPVTVQLPWTRDLLRQQAPRLIADGAVTWYFFFAAWASFYVAMSAGSQLRNAERRASEFERAAQSAQLRALRYQVNPHFLFNTLNSLSSLIMSRREDEAERMILSLSNFFRSTLAVDPTSDVSLAEEIRFQMLYLDIEKARFPSRLNVQTEIPDELLSARMPALLLQPVIENAIKYGVARAKQEVTLSIHAAQEEGRLRVTIENDADPADQVDDHGTGVGLTNVCERLSARFGGAAECQFGPIETGGYRVILTMPLVRNG